MSEPSRPERLVSLDALRGFDMACILGLGEVFRLLAVAFGAKPHGTDFVSQFAAHFEHVKWEGLHFEDIIFPLFVFIAGVSLTFSLPRAVARVGHRRAVLRLLGRCAVLFLLGIFVNGGLANGFDKVRWLGVLQRIAIASLGAGILVMFFKTRGLIVATIAILVSYWALMKFVPVPGFGAGDFAERHNLANWMDANFLAGRRYDGSYDPEGILSSLPAIATALFGVLAGRWLLGPVSSERKAAWLAIAGTVLLLSGWAWSWDFPVVKKLWTSSYVLVTAGWSALLLALFYWVVEILRWRAWTTPFVWIGMNPIALYVAANLVMPKFVAERFTGRLDLPHSPAWAWWPFAVGFALVLLLARFLYKRGIFLRV